MSLSEYVHWYPHMIDIYGVYMLFETYYVLSLHFASFYCACVPACINMRMAVLYSGTHLHLWPIHIYNMWMFLINKINLYPHAPVVPLTASALLLLNFVWIHWLVRGVSGEVGQKTMVNQEWSIWYSPHSHTKNWVAPRWIVSMCFQILHPR